MIDAYKNLFIFLIDHDMKKKELGEKVRISIDPIIKMEKRKIAGCMGFN